MASKNKKATVVITYNSVRGYPAGTYEGKNGPVVIYSQDNTSTWDSQAEAKLGQVLHGIYGRSDSQDVKQVYLYVGLNAKEGALRAAERLSKESKLTLVACDCDSGQKQSFANRLNLPLIWSECGGRGKLQQIVDKELN